MSECPNIKYEKLFNKYGDPTEDLHKSFDSWLDDMSSREGAVLKPFEFDLKKHPEQSIYVPKTEAKDPYWYLPDSLYYYAFRKKLSRSLGSIACLRLLNEISEQPVSKEDDSLLIERLIQNKKIGRKTMIVTSHFNFQEMGYFKALRFIAEKDRKNISKNGILLNKLMTRQSYKGKKLIDQFSPMSNIYYSNPISISSEKHNVPKDSINLGNFLFKMVLAEDMLNNNLLEFDVALTGKQVIPNKDSNNEIESYQIPNITKNSARLIENFDDIVDATLIKSPITGEWEIKIGDIVDIQENLKYRNSADIVDMKYLNIAKSIEEITQKEVIYNKII